MRQSPRALLTIFPRLSATVTMLVMFFSLAACSQVQSQSASNGTLSGQPGAAALKKIQENQVSDPAVAAAIISGIAESKEFGRMVNQLKSDQTDDAARLLLAMAAGQPLEEATLSLAQEADSEKAMGQVIKAAYILFPLEQAGVYHFLLAQLDVRKTLQDKWAENAGLLTVSTMPPPDSDGVFIQPLINSASITLSGLSEETRGAVFFKPQDTEQWQKGRDLVWEPVNGVLTGPIVHLQADTAYDVKVVLTEQQEVESEIAKQFTTRPDKPVINPDKVYKLSEIYEGGMLDLEALGIEGDENGYAKIVGDKDTVIRAGDDEKYAINVGDNSYIYFENITIESARVHAFYGEEAHDIWINQCDISGWGRAPNVMKKGIAYEMEDAQPINYDSAIYFRQSGVITVENCDIHDPRAIANDWSFGHPKGPNAFLAHANHPDPRFKGQIILRNNHFHGAPEHRFNDIIEGRKNAEPLGGFVRDSAIYNNELAYSNDDAIEIDGGQQNVLVYNNDISHTYSGISITPVRVGPSFIFNNYIHDLGDLRTKQWASIKMGGLLTSPAGQSVIMHNLITVGRNGLTASRFKNDDTFWTYAQNNVVITEKDNNQVGYAVYDPEGFTGSQFVNNYFYNLKSGAPKIEGTITEPYVYSESKLNQQIAEALFNGGKTVMLPKCDKYRINNFTQRNEDGTQALYGIVE